jgi:hypothetical protein
MTTKQLITLAGSIDALNRALQDLWSESRYPFVELNDAIKALGISEVFQHHPPVQYPPIIMLPRETDDMKTANSVVEIERLKEEVQDVLSKPNTEVSDLLLFIGLNPSTTSRGAFKVNQASNSQPYNKGAFNGMRGNMLTDLNTHPYFQPIREFRTQLHKYHIDLFALYHTSQTNVDRVIGWACTKNSKRLLAFFEGQVEAVHAFVQSVQPAQTAVINAFARDVLIGTGQQSRGGTRWGMINKCKQYVQSSNWTISPARLENASYHGYMHSAAMLSGQRAMDKGSRERLESVSMAVRLRGGV